MCSAGKIRNKDTQQELLKIKKSPALLNYIKDSMIKKKWAPDVISGTLKAENNDLIIENSRTKLNKTYIFSAHI